MQSLQKAIDDVVSQLRAIDIVISGDELVIKFNNTQHHVSLDYPEGVLMTILPDQIKHGMRPQINKIIRDAFNAVT